MSESRKLTSKERRKLTRQTEQRATEEAKIEALLKDLEVLNIGPEVKRVTIEAALAAKYAKPNLDNIHAYIHPVSIDTIRENHGTRDAEIRKRQRQNARVSHTGFMTNTRGVLKHTSKHWFEDSTQQEVYRVISKDGSIDKIMAYDGVLPFVGKVAGEDTTLYNYEFHDPKSGDSYIINYADIPKYTFYRFEPHAGMRTLVGLRKNTWRRRRHLVSAHNRAAAENVVASSTAGVTGGGSAAAAAAAPKSEKKKSLAEILAEKRKTTSTVPTWSPSGSFGGGARKSRHHRRTQKKA